VEERNHYGELMVRFLFEGPSRTGMLHADPHPGNYRVIPGKKGRPGRLGVLDFGAVARLPDGRFPDAMGTLIRLTALADKEPLMAELRREGFIKDNIKIDPDLLVDYLSPLVEPTLVERFRFNREWMREQFQRINNPREPTYTVAIKLNLPPEYMLIHRTWIGGIGVLSQLEAEAPFRQILTDYLPGFADPS
jgi:predicted unusual protein kinase regulating ubiquinone biosynthesis (AarF/ABC1/UbiB family)